MALTKTLFTTTTFVSLTLLVTNAFASPPTSSGNTGLLPGLNPDRKFVADSQKGNLYRDEGVIDGGDSTVTDVLVQDIRYSTNLSGRGFERIVFDVASSQAQGTERPPYYHFWIQPEARQIRVTLMGRPQLAFDIQKVKKSFQKSHLIRAVDLLPPVVEDRWEMVLHLKKPFKAEVFQLSQPLRIILDIAAAGPTR